MTLFEIFINYKEAFLQGLFVTLKLCILIWFLGIFFGSLFGIIGSRYSLAGNILKTVSTLVSGVPVIVLLYWLYYPVQQQLQVDVDPFLIAVSALSFVNVLAVSGLVKEAISNMPNQFLLAAKVSGLSHRTTLMKIQIPLIFKQLLGPLLLLQISMLHNSIFASLINVDDIFRQIQRINAMVYKPIELYTALALFFIVITVPLTLFALFLKQKYIKDYSER